MSSNLTTRANRKEEMQKIRTYFQESYDELVHKVSWPSWSELQASSLLVAVASVIIALLVYAMDYSFSNLLSFYYRIFG
ncbi:MAG: preprotein translocase subunit SecE [Flavobacteriales bacterium]|nr:preprotein translocase subunit SecE [Flavobacteriales bacterium]